MHCPRCTFLIEPVVTRGVEIDHCRRCGGTFFDAGEAPGAFGEGARFDAWHDLWSAHDAKPSVLKCPKDATPMHAHGVPTSGAGVMIDVCPHCHGMWLDRDEGKQLHPLVERALHGHGAGGYLFQFFTQLPLEVKAYRLWMLVPADVLGGEHAWTLLTHGFLHAGWLHLLGNLYFLWIFGDNVEDHLGKRDFAILYVGALVAGGLAHLIANPHSHAPMLGASGAIAGLMGAYLVLFPRVQLWVMLFALRVRMRVIWYLGAWLVLQIVMQSIGARGTAWMAHLGGFAVGALTALLLRPRRAWRPARA
jgi:membrane associated rhomboid family serine protease